MEAAKAAVQCQGLQVAIDDDGGEGNGVDDDAVEVYYFGGLL